MSLPPMTPKAQAAYEKALKLIEVCLRKGDEGTFLGLNGLGLTLLPPEIGQLSALTELRLFNNQLTSLPPEIGQLSALTELAIFNNLLRSLPPEIGQLASLRVLRLDNNSLTSLRPEIGRLTELTVLDLDKNQLASLPPEIGQLTALTGLYLRDNQLRSLPPEIGELKGLKRLILEGNALQSLPESMKQLAALEMLALHGNKALGLPAEVLGSSSLKAEVKAAREAELGLPAEVLGSSSFVSTATYSVAKPQAILEYYFASLGDKGQALREVKVLVVGRGGVGKTSVIRRLKGLPLDRLQSETHGIAIDELTLACEDGPVAARVWDFGGQHVLHAMHEFFFTGRSLYLLVLGEREDMAERDAEYWLQLIRSYAGKAPVIVVLNKSGGRARELDLPRRKLEQAYGPILAWLPTECRNAAPEGAPLLAAVTSRFRASLDAADKSGITALKREITSAVGNMPEIHARFPKKWMQIKEWLSGMKESYLDYDAYAQRCDGLGESDPVKQEELAAFLHDLGVALNYRRDPRLHETTVLRPAWLADGIYALLRANDTRHSAPLAPDGRISLEKMPAIYAAAEDLKMLKASDYPAQKHPFLLRLMAAFQLSFPLDEEGTEHLVPALLSVEEPSEIPIGLLANKSLELRWEFPVLPGPMLPRLLVRTLGLVKNNWWWRRGALYVFGPSAAKVWEEKERFIYMSAAAHDEEHGPEAMADLVRMIRAALVKIAEEYNGLAVQEQVLWQGDWLPRRVAVRLGACAVDEVSNKFNQEEPS